MPLTKKNINDKLVKKLNISGSQALDITNSFFDSIKQALENGEDVKLSGFGNFVLNDKKSRPGRNPKTGEDFVISARRVVTFKAGTKLKKIVNEAK